MTKVSNRRRTLGVLLLGVIATATVAACGDDDDEGGAAAPETATEAESTSAPASEPAEEPAPATTQAAPTPTEAAPVTTTAEASASSAEASSAADSGIAGASALVAQYSGDDMAGIDLPPLSAQPPDGLKVAYVICQTRPCNKDALAEPVEALGWELDKHEFDTAKGPQEEAAAFDRALDGNPDYLLYVNAFGRDATAAQLDRAVAEGVKVAELNGADPDPRIVGTLNGAEWWKMASRLAVAKALDDAGGPTHIGFLKDPAYPPVANGLIGAQEAIEQYGEGSQLSEIEISFHNPAAENVATVTNFLRRNPDVKYIISPVANFATGLPQGLEQAGLLEDVKLIVNNPEASHFEDMRDGRIWAGVSMEYTAAWWRAVDMFARLAAGDELTDDMTVPVGWARIWTQEDAASNPALQFTDPDQIFPDAPNYQDTFRDLWQVSGA